MSANARWRAIAGVALAGALLAAMGCAGCASAPTAPQRTSVQLSSVRHGSVQSCIQFGVSAIEHRMVVRTIPPACRGLTRAEVNFAVASAVHQIAARVPGKANQRRRTARLAPYLAHLITPVPSTHPAPLPPTPTVRPAPASTGALGLLALCCWLVTVGLGSVMMARWMSRRALRRAFRVRAGPEGSLSPAVAFTHFGLAVAGLLAWIVYLATSTTLVGWIACAALLPTAGFGMSLVFLGTARRPALVVAAHITLAAATMLLTLLTVVNTSAAAG